MPFFPSTIRLPPTHLAKFGLRIRCVSKLPSHPHHPRPFSLLSSSICLSTLHSSSQHTAFSQLILYPISTLRSRQIPELVDSVSPAQCLVETGGKEMYQRQRTLYYIFEFYLLCICMLEVICGHVFLRLFPPGSEIIG